MRDKFNIEFQGGRVGEEALKLLARVILLVLAQGRARGQGLRSKGLLCFSVYVWEGVAGSSALKDSSINSEILSLRLNSRQISNQNIEFGNDKISE